MAGCDLPDPLPITTVVNTAGAASLLLMLARIRVLSFNSRSAMISRNARSCTNRNCPILDRVEQTTSHGVLEDVAEELHYLKCESYDIK